MNELSQFLVDSILSESNGVDDVKIIYSDRFQPMHKGHYEIFKQLQEKFGNDNVYVGTSNNTNDVDSPFNFKEKVEIITRLHGIPKNRIIELSSSPDTQHIIKENNIDSSNITVITDEDIDYLNELDDVDVRRHIRSLDKVESKIWAEETIFTKMDGMTFNMVYDKLRSTPEINESTTFIPKKYVEDWIVNNQDFLKEATLTNGATEADDGPIFLYPDFNTFDKVSRHRAEQIGYELFKQIMSAELTDIDPHPQYPTGPVTANSYYPAGVIGKLTVMNQQDYKENEAYAKWLFHVTRTMALTGYSLVGDMDIDMFDSFDYADDDNTGNKLKGDASRDLSEDINLPVKIGDTILTGRFKNKKTVVKTIGTDDHGMPTINGRKVVTFRFPKETGTIFKKNKK